MGDKLYSTQNYNFGLVSQIRHKIRIKSNHLLLTSLKIIEYLYIKKKKSAKAL